MTIYFKAALTGIQKTMDVINQITDNMKFQSVEDELYFHLISVVHFVGDLYPRFKNNGSLKDISDEEKTFLLGFCYLNNQLKHDFDLNMIYREVCGSMFPLRFPMRFGPPGVYWRDFDDHGQSKEARREYYDKHLKDRDVLVTLNELKLLLEKISNSKV